ncbi:hypothetical protein OO18_29230 [Raoultella ornithinolytica]|nr:hypothetical protein OO18_29230 [Raoultella ornithinolytica]
MCIRDRCSQLIVRARYDNVIFIINLFYSCIAAKIFHYHYLCKRCGKNEIQSYFAKKNPI